MEDNLSNITENEKNRNNKLKVYSPQDEKSRLTKLIELIGFITAMIALCSIILTVVIKYISLGRCLFFDFDLDYYDFSILNTSKYLYILSIIAGIISIVMSFILYEIWNFLLSFIYKSKFKKKKIWKCIAAFILFIIVIFFNILLSFYFIPEKYSARYFCLLIFICSYAITSFLLIQDVKISVIKDKIIVWSIGIFSFMILFFASLSMRYEYKQASEQKVFPIIIENNNECYVVINQNKENYSAYLCEFKIENEKDVLIIRTDIHKYFRINDTKIIKIEFNKVERLSTNPLTVHEFLTNQAH